ncbi:MAG TPA: sigma-70 family RNA polymerase sigma factor [Thermomicrobiales bacterium]|nr:sigma-70 family RNA polymerase sigma factor [Thermomicrobiales bacterium]
MAGRTLSQNQADLPEAAREVVGDDSLVTAAQRDPRAFAPLYDRYLDPIYRYCYRSLGSREAAEDATSLVFSRALASLRSCDPPSFRSWLFAIAHNTLANTVRDRRLTASLDLASGIADPLPSPEDEALAAEERNSLRALLGHLPDDQRRVLELRLAGLSGPETAAALGKTHGAVKIAQHRAFTRLRSLLGVGAGKEACDGRH